MRVLLLENIHATAHELFREAGAHIETAPSALSEDELIARACDGEAEAFGVLVTRYEARLFNFLVRYVGHREAARDLCQESFLRAFKGLPGFRVGAPFKPWLYRVAVNTANSHLRRASRREVGVDALPDDQAPHHGSTAQTPPAAPARAQAAPRYRVDPFWPKPLPNKWSMQQIVDIYVDRFDHIWAINRGSDARPDELAAETKPPRPNRCSLYRSLNGLPSPL